MILSLFMKFLIAIFIYFSLNTANALPASLAGKSIPDMKNTTVDSKDKKGLVVVFLSALCPCSNSHVKEVIQLSQQYPDFSFVGVHSNADETKEQTIEYFKKINPPFPVLHDENSKIANEFKALKTPHAFVVLNNGETAYQGGVSSSQTFENAKHKFLREALNDLTKGEKVKTTSGRTLGCAITREGKHAW